ncbi:hypothetical protein BS50DRAFT_577971 [Corynespora cassiicola Philippines]|uniref:Uncharacterized protein n=1 Tax=Corynespora cassiicola Philippines TaxID=1448308 RepID=A0A2T2N9L8_CORCC|nr:hypothetical protein BS50DRAFT_577971 [Corynespora cassiicola Philippines]
MAGRFEGVRGAQVCEWGEDSVVHPDEPFWNQLQGVMEVQGVLIAQGWGSEDGWVGEKMEEEDAGDETSEKKVGKKWGKGIKKGKPAIDKSKNQSDPQRMGKNQREAQCDGDRKKGKKGQKYKKNKKRA